MHSIGVDYYKRYSCIEVKDGEGQVVGRGMVGNTREEVRDFLAPYRPGTAVLEATRNWGLMYECLEDIQD